MVWGVIAVEHKRGQEHLTGRAALELGKNREAITRMAKSGEARRLMELLEREGGVQQAAKAAAAGDPRSLMSMMEQLMRTKEGAELIERIESQAKKEGLR